MAYTTINDPSEHFGAVLFTGHTHNIPVGMNMRPDFFWFKSRTQTYSNIVFDTSRPADGSTMPSGDVNMYNFLATDSDADEDDNNADGVVQTSTGFIVDGDGQAIGEAGQGVDNMVCWAWKANGGTTTTNDASATSVGSIDSVYQANTTAGFSIVTYTGTGSAGTIAHGLGVKPELILFKNRNKSSGEGWAVYHGANTAAPETDGLHLNLTNATNDDTDYWNDQAPTTTTFGISGDDRSGGSYNYVAYVFNSVQGYSKFGSYTGNGNAAGTFIYTGFKPAWVIVKLSSGSGEDWHIFDSKRSTSNVVKERLIASGNAAENANDSILDFVSNGFKFRENNAGWNGDGNTYVYMAFAESPFVTSNGTPNNAR